MSRIQKCLVAVLATVLLLSSLGHLAGCAKSKIPTSTTVTKLRSEPCSSSSDNTPCQSVTLTVVVGTTDLTDTPTGAIDFRDGATFLGTIPLLPGEEARATLDLFLGTHEITASYGGDAHFAKSKSAVETVNVGNWTRTTLTSSRNPSALGDSVTFTATVTPRGGVGTPTGTVAFYERYDAQGGEAIDRIATVTIDSGQANCITSSLSVGVHKIYACYNGDADFAESTSLHRDPDHPSELSGYLMQAVN
jgi:hypothetical protein